MRAPGDNAGTGISGDASLEARLDAARRVLDTEPEPPKARNRIAQWFNWPNWDNWPNWNNWGNWANWANW